MIEESPNCSKWNRYQDSRTVTQRLFFTYISIEQYPATIMFLPCNSLKLRKKIACEPWQQKPRWKKIFKTIIDNVDLNLLLKCDVCTFHPCISAHQKSPTNKHINYMRISTKREQNTYSLCSFIDYNDIKYTIQPSEDSRTTETESREYLQVWMIVRKQIRKYDVERWILHSRLSPYNSCFIKNWRTDPVPIKWSSRSLFCSSWWTYASKPLFYLQMDTLCSMINKGYSLFNSQFDKEWEYTR